MHPVTRVTYQGAALPADSDTEVLFDSTLNPNPSHQAASIKKFLLSVDNDQAGTVNAYKSEDHGVTWVQIDTQPFAAAGTPPPNEYELVVEALENFKVEWVNGGVTQTAFGPSMALSTERS